MGQDMYRDPPKSATIGGSWPPDQGAMDKIDIPVDKDLGMTLDRLLKRREVAHNKSDDLQARLRSLSDEIRVLDIAIGGLSNALEPAPTEDPGIGKPRY